MAGRTEVAGGARSTSARPVRILGLDLSLTASGLACPECGTEVISFPRLRAEERLVAIREQVLAHLHAADVIVIEGYSFGSRGSAMYDIGELGGVVRVALFEREMPFVEIPPARVKKFATGKGNAGKDEVIAAVVRRYPEFTGSNNNEADAFVLRKMGVLHYTDDPGAPAYQQDAIAEIPWPVVKGPS